jgi:hypothetical protein
MRRRRAEHGTHSIDAYSVVVMRAMTGPSVIRHGMAAAKVARVYRSEGPGSKASWLGSTPSVLQGAGQRTKTRLIGTIAKKLKRLIKEWSEAVLRRDAETVGRLLDDRFVCTDPVGGLWDKKNYLKEVEERAWV